MNDASADADADVHTENRRTEVVSFQRTSRIPRIPRIPSKPKTKTKGF